MSKAEPSRAPVDVLVLLLLFGGRCAADNHSSWDIGGDGAPSNHRSWNIHFMSYQSSLNRIFPVYKIVNTFLLNLLLSMT